MRRKLLLFLIFTVFPLFGDNALQNHIDSAYNAYKKGENTQDLVQKQAYFNQALTLYKQLINDESPSHSGKVDLMIANTYFHLKDFGSAIYYYEKARQKMPRNTVIQKQLQLATLTQGVAPKTPSLLNRFFSNQEILFLGIVFAVFTTLFLSLTFYHPSKATTALVISCFALFLLFALPPLFSTYFASKNAILIDSAPLLIAPNTQAAPLSTSLNPSGTWLKIKKTSPNGQWVYVQLQNGKQGYLPINVVRIL